MRRGLPVSTLTKGNLYLPVIGDDRPRPLIILEKVGSGHYREFNNPDSKPKRIPKDEHMFQVVLYSFGELHQNFQFTPVEEGERVRVELENLFRKENGKGVRLDPYRRGKLADFKPDQLVVSLGIAGITIKCNGGDYPMLTVEH